MFPRVGDLWRGQVDWSAGKILKPERFTETGYFRDDVFRGPWMWHEDDLLVSMMGKTLQVKLQGGSVKEMPVRIDDLRRGMNPDGTFVVVTPGGLDIGVVDILSGKTAKFQISQPVRKLLWLSSKKVLMLLGREKVVCYDHEKKKLLGPWDLEDPVADILEPSPDGKAFLAMGLNKLLVLDSEAEQLAAITMKLDQIYWVSEEALLGSSNAMDTDSRGLWLVEKTGRMEKLSGHPLDSSRQVIGTPFLLQGETAFFVSGGNLWSVDLKDYRVKQLSQGAKLPPALQLLSH